MCSPKIPWISWKPENPHLSMICCAIGGCLCSWTQRPWINGRILWSKQPHRCSGNFRNPQPGRCLLVLSGHRSRVSHSLIGCENGVKGFVNISLPDKRSHLESLSLRLQKKPGRYVIGFYRCWSQRNYDVQCRNHENYAWFAGLRRNIWQDHHHHHHQLAHLRHLLWPLKPTPWFGAVENLPPSVGFP